MLIVRKAEVLIRKKKLPSFIKKKKLSHLIVSLLLWQKQTSLPPTGTFRELEKIVVTDNRVMQQPIPWLLSINLIDTNNNFDDG